MRTIKPQTARQFSTVHVRSLAQLTYKTDNLTKVFKTDTLKQASFLDPDNAIIPTIINQK